MNHSRTIHATGWRQLFFLPHWRHNAYSLSLPDPLPRTQQMLRNPRQPTRQDLLMRQHVMEEADAARQPTPGIPTANRLGGGATARGGRWQHEHAFQCAAWALRKRCVRVRQGHGTLSAPAWRILGQYGSALHPSAETALPAVLHAAASPCKSRPRCSPLLTPPPAFLVNPFLMK